jgi:predicted MFS family arabinose efflux permease
MEVTMGSSFWTRNTILLALTFFFVWIGQGLWTSVNTNYFVQDLALSGRQILWLAGIREIPGLLLVFLAALVMRLPLSRRAGASLLLMGLGFGCYGLVHTYTALIAVALVGSIGFHNWFAVSNALGIGLAEKGRAGRILGRMNAVGMLASVVGMVMVMLLSERLGLRPFYFVSGVSLMVAAIIVSRLPTDIGGDTSETPRLLFRRRYWLYYVLILFQGVRTQVFAAFGPWVLVQFYQVAASQLAMLMVISRMVNLFVAPRVGDWVDRLGERRALTGSYLIMAAAFVGYATFHNVWLLALMYILINLLFLLRFALATYVDRIAPAEELAPTLSAGVSVNHVTSVGVSLIVGGLIGSLGYETLCYGAAAIILLSCPFALALRVPSAERHMRV